jgi:hypothetical protein
MTKIWTTEANYPEHRMALYNYRENEMDRFELQAAKRFVRIKPLSFGLPWAGVDKIRSYGVIWTDILIPLVSDPVRVAITEVASDENVQFIPVTIKSRGQVINEEYFLLNPTQKIDAIDHNLSDPIMVNVSGHPPAKVGFKRMVLRSDFPPNGIGRQIDSMSFIIVGDYLVDAVLSVSNRGVRFVTGIPPDS